MIDIFPHIVPGPYLEVVQAIDPQTFPPSRLAERPSLHDIDARLRVMDEFPGYVQVLTLCQPPVEDIGDGSRAAELARIANEAMADIVRRYPNRFVGFAATLPNADPDQALLELEYSVRHLGALGAQIHTNVRGTAWDAGRFEPFFATMEALDRPIWVHPARGPQFADYATEERSMYGLHAALGWPFDTAVFVARLVFGGVLDRHPRIKIVTHHGGGMIPHFAQRLGRRVGRLPDQWPSDPEEITARATELCRRLYADTALNGSIHAVRCSLAFFGADHLLFGTDMPFDDENGRACVRDTIANIAELQVSESDRRSMLSGTAERLLGLAERPSVATARQ